MDELLLSETYEISYLDMLLNYWPMSLVGLTAAFVIFSEAYCIRKGGRLESAYAIVFLLLVAGIGSVCAYFVRGSVVFSSGERMDGVVGYFYAGDRLPIEPWYYPSIVALFLLFSALFSIGMVSDFRKAKRKVVVIRLSVFIMVSYIAVSVASVPYQINAWLKNMEEAYLQDSRRDHD